jgi:hypothetical protein
MRRVLVDDRIRGRRAGTEQAEASRQSKSLRSTLASLKFRHIPRRRSLKALDVEADRTIAFALIGKEHLDGDAVELGDRRHRRERLNCPKSSSASGCGSGA